MQHRLVSSVLIGASLIFVATGCTKQNELSLLQQRVQTQDQQLRQLQPGMADSWAQMQAMREEINALKGQMDDLKNAGGARALVDKVNRHDEALRQVERSMALNLNLDAPATPLGGAPGESTAPFAPTEAQTATGTATSPMSSGTMIISPQGTLQNMPQGIAPNAEAPSAPPQAQPPAVAPVQKDLATALYDAGMQAFNARKYQEAQRSFTDLTTKYPNNKQVANAWFYTGECYFLRNQFADAALAYDRVITKHAGSARAPGAYLKQGICFSKLKQTAAATARLQELIKKYPNTPEAARAKTFLQTNK